VYTPQHSGLALHRGPVRCPWQITRPSPEPCPAPTPCHHQPISTPPCATTTAPQPQPTTTAIFAMQHHHRPSVAACAGTIPIWAAFTKEFLLTAPCGCAAFGNPGERIPSTKVETSMFCPQNGAQVNPSSSTGCDTLHLIRDCQYSLRNRHTLHHRQCHWQLHQLSPLQCCPRPHRM
jgi:hypothetical protein